MCNEKNGRWLLVLDGADDPAVFFKHEKSDIADSENRFGGSEALARYLPQSPNGSILVTSRFDTTALKLVGARTRLVRVEAVTEEDSITLLRAKMPADKMDEDKGRELIRLLEGIPLAISHAAAYLDSRRRSQLGDYIELFKKTELNQMHLLSHDDAGDLRREATVSNSVILTWQMSFEQVQRERPSAAELLSLMSMFDKSAIPESFLTDSKEKHDFEDSIDTLLRFSLITLTSNFSAFNMHWLVQLAIRRRLEMRNELSRWETESIKRAAGFLLSFDLHKHRAVAPHLLRVLKYTAKSANAELDQARIAFELAKFAINHWNWEFGESLVRLAQSFRTKRCGTEHTDTIESTELLARILWSRSRFKEAAKLFRRVLAALTRAEGLYSEKRWQVMVSLAKNQADSGSFDEAERIQMEVLSTQRIVLGDGHILVLCAMCQFGSLLQQQERWAKAEKVYAVALKMSKRVSKPEPSMILECSDGLRDVFIRQHRYIEAARLQMTAADVAPQLLDTNFLKSTPDIVSNEIKNLLLSRIDRLERLDKSEASDVQTLTSRRERLGREHPDTLKASAKLARIMCVKIEIGKQRSWLYPR